MQVECDVCATTLHLRSDDTAVNKVCPKCGSSLNLPRPAGLSEPRRLADASPEEMVNELQRRMCAAVMLVLDESADHAALPAREIGAHNIDQRQLAKVYRQLGEVAASRAASQERSKVAPEDDVFDLKGDSLGMSLADFKKKHFRKLPGSDLTAPWSSDNFPGQRIGDLRVEPWYTAAGLVNARLDYPAENSSPSIAGMPTSLVLYQFVDNKLYQITALFSPESFHELSNALRTRFNDPVDEIQNPRQLQWWTLDSTIALTQGAFNPATPTVLSYCHDKLINEAAARLKDAASDL